MRLAGSSALSKMRCGVHRQTRGFTHGMWGVMTLGLGLLCKVGGTSSLFLLSSDVRVLGDLQNVPISCASFIAEATLL